MDLPNSLVALATPARAGTTPYLLAAPPIKLAFGVNCGEHEQGYIWSWYRQYLAVHVLARFSTTGTCAGAG